MTSRKPEQSSKRRRNPAGQEEVKEEKYERRHNPERNKKSGPTEELDHGQKLGRRQGQQLKEQEQQREPEHKQKPERKHKQKQGQAQKQGHQPSVDEPPQASSDSEDVTSTESLTSPERPAYNGNDNKLRRNESAMEPRPKKLKRQEPVLKASTPSMFRQGGIFELLKRKPGPKTYSRKGQPLQPEPKPEQQEEQHRSELQTKQQGKQDGKGEDGESPNKLSERQSAVDKNMALLDELIDGDEHTDLHHEHQETATADGAHTASGESSLSDAQSVASNDAEDEDGKISSGPTAVLCPVCSAQVDSDLEDECIYISTQPFKKQSAFCHQHTRRKAEGEWSALSYPDIEWDKIEDRITACLPILEDIIAGKRRSYYRKLVTAQASEGGNKSTSKKFRLTVESKSLESISTGYYGPRGAKLMVDILIRHFARKMRKLAPSDDLIKNASVAGFVQAVLVPELTLLFVKEDMHVGDKEARHIIEHSERIGELLNEQPHDSMTVDF